nr:hypothetical protein BaRGS_026447 [Batillaria attramentaria]
MAKETLTERNVSLARLSIYLFLSFLSLVIGVPLILVSAVMDGRCLLNMRAGEEGESEAACAYVLVVSLGGQLPFSIICSIFLTLSLLRVVGKDQNSNYTMVCWLVADVIFGTLMMSLVTVMRCGDPFPFPAGSTLRWDRNYFYRLFMSEVGGWSSMGLWLFLMVLDTVDVCLLRRDHSRDALRQGPRDLKQALSRSAKKPVKNPSQKSLVNFKQ